MRHRLTSIVTAVALIVPALVMLTAVPAAANVFSNPASITLNDPNSQSNGNNNATATPYPSTIAVSGMSGTVNHVAVTLSNVSYSHSQDIDILLVGPGGQTLILVANLGPNSGPTAPAANSTLTLSDAGSLPSMLTPWGASNTFKPVNFGGFNEVWEPPAPPGPYGDPGANGTGATLASIFNGTNPNGTWSLFVITTAGGDGTGAIAGGWSIDVTTASVAATTTTISSNNNPSFTAPLANSVTFTSTVKKTSDSSNVNEGTATFTDGGSPITGCTAVAVSAGVATCTTSFTTEGNHVIVANYNGTANFGPSHSPNLTQVVNNHTTVTGSNFCNTGSITLNNPPNTVADATPYPSNVFVSGLAGVVNHVAVTLNNVTYSHSQDIDVLLVSPGGQTLILVANLGPNSGAGAAVSNQTVTFSDAGVLPPSGMTTSWSALSIVKPVNFGGFNEVWGPPAPPGPYGDPGTSGAGATFASAFNGSTASGTWSLYVITTASGDGTGAIAGGWCANITAAAVAATTTALNSDNNPSFTTAPGNAVNLTATVKKASDSSNVNEGTVAFTDGGSPISGCTSVAVSAGSATCATSFSTEGVHNITAQYSGTANFGASSANLAQVVNNHTTVTGNNFCNTGSITLNNPPNTVTDATPYPSNVFVSGLGGPITGLTVKLKNTTYSHSQDIDALLVGPGGQTLILVANLGPNSGAGAPASDATLTFSDAGILPPSGQSTSWAALSTIKPVNYGGFNETWGPPAPPGPYGDPGTTGTGATLGSVFNGTVPNGTWSLYVITTAAGDGTGAIAGGWCLGITSPQPPTLAKAFGAPSVPNGGSTSLSFTVTNPNASASLSGIAFTDPLPNGLVVATPNGLSGSCGTITANTGATSVTMSGLTLAASASCIFSVNVTATSTGTKVNTTSVPSSVEGGSGTAATATLVVAAPATLTKAFGAPSVALNGSTSLTFTLANPNTTIALTGVGFSDTLPSGLIVSTPNGLTGSCGGGAITATAGSSSVTLAGATLAGGASCTFSVNVTGTTAGAKVNTTSTVSSNEAGAGSAATATVTVNSGPPQITKSFGAATIPLNGFTSLSFTITNPAANGTSTGIGFTDSLPSGLVVSTPNGLSGSCGGGTITADVAATSVALSGATLAAGASCTFSVNVTGTTAGVKNNSVTVSSANGGTGNTSNATVTVVAPPALTKAFGAASVPLGGTTSLTFTVANSNSTVSLSGIGFTDTLPAGLVVATPNGLTGSCGGGSITATAGSPSVSLSAATLAAGASCTFAVNVTGTTAGSKVNTTSVVSSTEGGNGAPATATLAVIAPPVIAKSFGAGSLALNGTTTLSFTITNPNAGASLTGVAFTDTLPSGLVVSTPNGLTGSCGGGTITANAGATSIALSGATLVGGASCTFSVNVTGTTSGAKNNSVTVTSTNGGTGNTATATVSVALAPQITKSFGAATIPLNGSTSLSFTVTNPSANGAFTVTGIGFTDSLPAGLVVSTPNGLSGSCGGGTITANTGATSVALSGATLAAGASCTFSVNVTGTTAGVKNNSVTVTSANAGIGNTSNATVTVLAPPSLSKQFGASSIPLSGTTTLTFSLQNPNSSASLTGVGFTDTLPAGLVVGTPNGLTGSCDGGTITATAGSSSVSLSGATFGPLPGPTSTCTFAVDVTGTTAGAKVNTTSVVSSNEGGNGAPATATLTVIAPPQIAKSFGAAAIALNGSTTLSFTITNPNAGASLTGVAFTDTLPSGLVVSTPNGLSGSCGGGTITANTGATTVALSGATLAGGASCTFSVNVTGTTSGIKNNSVTVSSTNGGTGNTATATVSVALPPQITKSFGAATIPLNGSTSLSFTVTNPSANGTFSLTGIGFTDSLPAGLVVSTPNGLSGSCGGGTITANAGATSVALSGATLAAGASCAFSVNVTGTTAGVKNNSVTVTSTNAGTGNTSNATVTVVAPPTIAKAFGTASIPFGGTTSLSFTLTNPNSTVALTGVGFTDTLPAGLVVATPNGLSGSCGGGTITATAGSGSLSLAGATLAAGATCTFSVNVLAASTGTKVNTTSAVTSGNGGTGLTATATLTVTRAPTTTTVTASPTNPSLGSPVTFTATVVPSGPNGTGVGPTGTVSFFLDGQATPVAVVPLSGGMASFTTSGLGAGNHTVTATYSGDANFLPSSSTTSANVTVTCTTTISGGHTGTLVLGPGSTCVIGGTIIGSVIVPKGSLLDLEGATVRGNISASGAAFVRVCGTTSGSVTITGSTGFVLVGDAGDDGCAPNTINGALNLQNNTGGVEAIGNHVTGSVVASGNSGTGPFPEDTAPDITGNGP